MSLSADPARRWSAAHAKVFVGASSRQRRHGYYRCGLCSACRRRRRHVIGSCGARAAARMVSDGTLIRPGEVEAWGSS